MSNSATHWTVCILQAPLSMEFSRQEYWSDLPFPSLGDLPDPRVSCTAGRFPTMSHQGSPYMIYIIYPQKFPKSNCVYVNGAPQGLSSKESSCQAGDLSSIPGSGRSPGEGNGNPLQYSGLGSPMNRGAWLGYSPWGHKELDTT